MAYTFIKGCIPTKKNVLRAVEIECLESKLALFFKSGCVLILLSTADAKLLCCKERRFAIKTSAEKFRQQGTYDKEKQLASLASDTKDLLTQVDLPHMKRKEDEIVFFETFSWGY